jgi:hypothetical protein
MRCKRVGGRAGKLTITPPRPVKMKGKPAPGSRDERRANGEMGKREGFKCG